MSLSDNKRGASSSIVHSPCFPEPPPPPTLTCLPNGRLLTTAAIFTCGSLNVATAFSCQAEAFVTITSPTVTVGVGVSKRDGRLELWFLVSSSSSSSCSKPSKASSSPNATAYGVPESHVARLWCCTGMLRRKDARLPFAFLAFRELMSPPTDRSPRLHAACKIVPPPQQGSRTTPCSRMDDQAESLSPLIAPASLASSPNTSPTRNHPFHTTAGFKTAFSAMPAIAGCVPAL
mmetsp:Transcript_789/g.3043  ORF Transcript_789/g.3043 Transcript_789/m.3043 type:complete len:233 (+) Transcript_789:1172-1870(+)